MSDTVMQAFQKKCIESDIPGCAVCSHYQQQRDEARSRIEALEAQLAERWISVEDRLPGSEVQVLGALRGESGKYNISRINYTSAATDHDWEADGWELGNCWTVTHWMPLPAPPIDTARSESDG